MFILSFILLGTAPMVLVSDADVSEGLAGWNRYPENVLVEFSTDEAGPSVRIHVKDDMPLDYYHVSRSVPAQPGETFRVRADVLSDTIRGGGVGPALCLFFLDDQGQRIAHNDAYLPQALSHRHAVLQAEGVAPAGTVRASIVLLLHGHGNVDFRNISMERLASSIVPYESGVTLTVTNHVAVPKLIGFGAEDDGWFYNAENKAQGVDENAIAIREGRLEWLRPHYVRMFFWYLDWCPSLDGETFTWDTDNMISHYKTLDIYQRLGARVNVTGVEWNVENPWKDPESLARAIGALMEHLIVERGYMCIQDWTLTNEPNLHRNIEPDFFETYIRIHELVAQEFEQRGLNINIVGSDDADSLAWFSACVEEDRLFAVSDLYASHTYVSPSRVPVIQRDYQERIALLAEKEPVKPFIVAEFGLSDHRMQPPMRNPYMKDYEFALSSTLCFIKGFNVGTAGFVVWCIHEMYYPGSLLMTFGTWDFGGDWSVRPIYHVLALFTRNSMPGDTVYRVETTHENSVEATQIGNTLFWVNMSDLPQDVVVEGYPISHVHAITEDTLEGDRDCGTHLAVLDNAFIAPPYSFGYATQAQ